MAEGSLPSREFAGPTASEIADDLRREALALGQMIFPAGRLVGRFLCVGSLQGEAGDKLKIKVAGPKAGTWVDYGTSESDPRGKGDMLKLLQLTIGGGDLKRAIDEAKKFLNLDSMDPRALERHRLAAAKAQARAEAEAADDTEKRRRQSEGLWQSASALTPSSPAALYMGGRAIDFAALGRFPGAIRFHHAVWHDFHRCKLPAMVTKMTALDGRHAATHLTFLRFTAKGWEKLPEVMVDGKAEQMAKRIHGPAWALGAHIALWKGDSGRVKLGDVAAGTPLFLSEGIEDGLSYALADPSARVLAAGTLGLIGQVRLPPQAGTLTLLAQNDTKRRPIEQLEAAVRAQQAQAQEQGSIRKVALKYPPEGIKDWNDWLQALDWRPEQAE